MLRTSLVLLFALALAACGASATPQLIGSYPQEDAPAGAYPPPSPVQPPRLTYHASMELEVEDIHHAVAGVQWVAVQHSGYLLNSATWYERSLLYGEVTIAVPVGRFEAARSALHGLGSVRAENISGELQPGYGYDGAWEGYSNITVRLRPAAASWGRQVGNVLTGALRFLFWTAVSVVPPVLMGIGLMTVVRWVGVRIRRRARSEE